MENIEQATKAYAEDDAYWFKLYHLIYRIDAKILNILRDQQFAKKKLMNELLEKD